MTDDGEELGHTYCMHAVSVMYKVTRKKCFRPIMVRITVGWDEITLSQGNCTIPLIWYMHRLLQESVSIPLTPVNIHTSHLRGRC